MSESIYGERAALYDRLYHWKDYAREAIRLREWLTALGAPPGSRLLDVACGTGNHLQELRAQYDASGCDLEEGALELARRKLPGVHLFQADMTALRVERPFDALTCLFSAIGHLLTRAALERAAGAFARALRPGGVLVVEPWIGPDALVVGKVSMHTYEDEQLKLCRQVMCERRGELSVFDYHYLVARAEQGVEHWTEHMELRLTEPAELEAIFRAAGFDVRFEADGLMPGRGILLGNRR